MALGADGGCRSVAGNDSCVVGKCQQAGVYRVDDLFGVAAGKVGAADAAGKECVACNDHFERKKVEANGALGVAGCVQDLGGIVVESDVPAVEEAFVGRGGFGGLDAEPGGLGGHHLEQGQIVLVEVDGGSCEALELERATDVVNVGVRHENLLELEAEGREAAVNAGDFVAGVDDDGFGGAFVAHDGAVALQGADGERLEDHVFIVEGCWLVRRGVGFGAGKKMQVPRLPALRFGRSG